jgi:hypothetical protein
MDGDDICAPERFAIQVQYLDEHQHRACVGGSFMGIDQAGTHQEIFRYDRNTLTSFDTFPVRVALTCHPLAMFRRAALLAAGGYRSTFPHAEDYDLFLRIADFGAIETRTSCCSIIAVMPAASLDLILNFKKRRQPTRSSRRYWSIAGSHTALMRTQLLKLPVAGSTNYFHNEQRQLTSSFASGVDLSGSIENKKKNCDGVCCCPHFLRRLLETSYPDFRKVYT